MTRISQPWEQSRGSGRKAFLAKGISVQRPSGREDFRMFEKAHIARVEE